MIVVQEMTPAEMKEDPHHDYKVIDGMHRVKAVCELLEEGELMDVAKEVSTQKAHFVHFCQLL